MVSNSIPAICQTKDEHEAGAEQLAAGGNFAEREFPVNPAAIRPSDRRDAGRGTVPEESERPPPESRRRRQIVGVLATTPELLPSRFRGSAAGGDVAQFAASPDLMTA
jgi:hypothetical protein